jgi:hypothetical protein
MDIANKIEYSENPDFNLWLNENFIVEIEQFEFPSSEVLYSIKYEHYIEALARYNQDPQFVISRIINNFPTPIAYYLDQAESNYQNHHHRLDLLKSCWESIIFLIYGLVVGEARHNAIDLKSLGLNWNKFLSDKVHDKLLIVENILNKVLSSPNFECSKIIPISILADIRTLNQERNGFEHSSAKTTLQQQALYQELYPLVTKVLNQLIGLEKVKLFRYHDAQTPLLPRCEIFNGNSLSGKKEVIILKKENYIELMEDFDNSNIYAQINQTVFCVAPFIHFFQEKHETNAYICFYKKVKNGKYSFEVVSKSQNKDFDKPIFLKFETKIKSLI